MDNLTESTATLAGELTEFLRGNGHLESDGVVTTVVQLDGGWSRNTYRAEGTNSGKDVAFIVRAEVGAGLTGTPLDTEYAIYWDLQEFGIATPRVFGMKESAENAFGGPYFVMELLDGSAPNLWRWDAHDELRANWEGNRSLARDLAENLAAINLIAPENAPKALDRLGPVDLINKWRKVYVENRLRRDPVVEEAFAWLEENIPAPGRQGLVHGDYRLGNLLVADDRITAVLDWELAHIGDVNYDLGYVALEYIAGKHLLPKTELLAGVADTEWFFLEYERLTGDVVDRDAVRWWSVLTLVALIVMAMIGFSAYASGQANDIRRIWSRWALPGLRQELTQLSGW